MRRRLALLGVLLSTLLLGPGKDLVRRPGPADAPEEPQPPDLLELPVGDALPLVAKVRLGTISLRHLDLIQQIAFAPDGKSLASIARDKTLRIWDTRTGQMLHQFTGGWGGPGDGVAFSPDGKIL